MSMYKLDDEELLSSLPGRDVNIVAEKIKNAVKVKPSWKSKILDRYYGPSLIGEKGEITELYSEGRARVKFPKVIRWSFDNEPIEMIDFVWPFWIKDLESITDVIPKKIKHIRRAGRALKAKRDTAKRLKAQGSTIREISEQMESSENTVKAWLYR